MAHRSSSRLSLVTRPSSRLRPLNIPKEEEEEEEGTEDIPEDDDDDDESRDYSTLATRESFSGTSRSSSTGGDNTELSRDTYISRHSRYCRCASTQEIEDEDDFEDEDEDEDEDDEDDEEDTDMVEAKVVYASSHDPSFPPAAILDGRPDTFWASTGLYPQVVVVTLPGVTSVDSLSILAYNVRRVVVARSVKSLPTDFEDVVEKELPQVDGKLQNSLLSEQVTAAHLRLTITEGHGHFCSLHKVTVVGSSGGQPEQGSAKITAIVSSPKMQQQSPTRVRPKVIPVRRSGPEMDGGMDLTVAPDLTPTDVDEF